MWRPKLNFITLHYAYILSFGIIAMVVIYPFGNLEAIDAYFFGVSSSTESGLNTVDVKTLKTYQQLFIYFVPIITNLGFINVIIVIVRLHWFSKRFKELSAEQSLSTQAARNQSLPDLPALDNSKSLEAGDTSRSIAAPSKHRHVSFALEPPNDEIEPQSRPPFEHRSASNDRSSMAIADDDDEDDDVIKPARNPQPRRFSRATSVDQALSSIFVLGSGERRLSKDTRAHEPLDLATLTREELGGIEYSALRVLLKISAGYFIGLHVFGVICLLPWIHLSNTKYRDYLATQGQDATWWAFYSSQTMISNLGFTLTPDSMISFRDATWPMLLMTFLAFAGNTFYPCFLRLAIWITVKLAPTGSSTKQSVRFLLDHPRRCYALLFPSSTTWSLAIILLILNFIDVLLIITLDLDNAELTVLPIGPRIVAAIFQAASARHTGTAAFNLANVNPAVQFSLLVMMYISVYPIAISIRMSDSNEEHFLAKYGGEDAVNEHDRGRTYMITHMRNQLSFDLWYVFLGVFCICCAESKRIMDLEDPAFSVFSILFEVVSAYGNVGLSLGHPTNLTSLCGHFTIFSKLVICAMMIRGRHRGLPYALDRAVTLPSDRLANQEPLAKYTDEPKTED